MSAGVAVNLVGECGDAGVLHSRGRCGIAGQFRANTHLTHATHALALTPLT